MGIKSLNKFLRNNCPNVYEPKHLSEFAYQKIAVDTSLFLCKFKAIDSNTWLNSFVNLIISLRRNEVHPVFVFDNGCPKEKLPEREKRAQKRKEHKERIEMLEKSLKKFFETEQIDQNLNDEYTKLKNKGARTLLQSIGFGKKEIDINLVQDKLERLKKSYIVINPEDYEKLKNLFDTMNVPWIMAILEAETTCADLCKRSIVDAVLSDDTDVLAYKNPVTISKLNMLNDTCICIRYDNLLENLEIDGNQFLDLCIMCGTDYNSNIFRVGPEKSFKYLQNTKSGRIEDLPNFLDTTILNYKQVRKLFENYDKYKLCEKIDFCGRPDFDELSLFFRINNVRLDVNSLVGHFLPKVVFK